MNVMVQALDHQTLTTLPVTASLMQAAHWIPVSAPDPAIVEGEIAERHALTADIAQSTSSAV